MDLKTLQLQLPWGDAYSQEFTARNSAHKHFEHALVHIVKATGKLAAMVEDLDHDPKSIIDYDVKKCLADIVICAVRMASVTPDKPIDIDAAVVERIESKNNVKFETLRVADLCADSWDLGKLCAKWALERKRSLGQLTIDMRGVESAVITSAFFRCFAEEIIAADPRLMMFLSNINFVFDHTFQKVLVDGYLKEFGG